MAFSLPDFFQLFKQTLSDPTQWTVANIVAALAALAAIVAALAALPGAVSTLKSMRQKRDKKRAGDLAHRNRQAMIEKVRAIWITGMLNRSLYKETLITLGLAERLDAVERPMDILVQRSDKTDHPLFSGTRVLDVYDELGGALLILGAPGAGKTTLLQELTRDLLDRAEEDNGHPISVAFPLGCLHVFMSDFRLPS